MKEILEDYNLAQQIRTDLDAADQEMIKEAIERIDKGFETAKEAVSDTLTRGENLLKRARNSAEGYADDAVYEVRHNPLTAMALVFAGGAITGGLLALIWKKTKKLPTRASGEK